MIMISDKRPSENGSTKPKKAYAPPKLSNYGSVSKVTQGGGFVGNDGNTKCDTGQATTGDIPCS